jgi:hypothetical protein
MAILFSPVAVPVHRRQRSLHCLPFVLYKLQLIPPDPPENALVLHIGLLKLLSPLLQALALVTRVDLPCPKIRLLALPIVVQISRSCDESAERNTQLLRKSRVSATSKC